MIKLTDADGNNYSFEYTKFPDGTSQVWKINPEPKRMTNMIVTWMFEDEKECMAIFQLGSLLYKFFMCFPTLQVPYLVYGRQDKMIRNDSTFAKDVFIKLAVESGYTKIKTYDAHSDNIYVQSEPPTALIEAALPGHDVVCFPDVGAKKRYEKLIPSGYQIIYAEKVRNQLTGNIDDIKIETAEALDFKKILVLDDLCDGGGTFIGLSKELNRHTVGGKVQDLSLAVSHGLFTKGLDIIYEAGYNHIYTTNSLLVNEVADSKLWCQNSGGKQKLLTVIKVV